MLGQYRRRWANIIVSFLRFGSMLVYMLGGRKRCHGCHNAFLTCLTLAARRSTLDVRI